jgi:hypothetical protein
MIASAWKSRTTGSPKARVALTNDSAPFRPITVTNTGSALRTPTARRMLRGCRRGNQVLIFLSEADLPLKSQFRDLGLLGAPSIWQPRNWL